MKRFLALFLALFMMLSAMPASAATSKAQVYQDSIAELQKFLSSEDSMTLEDLYVQFDGLKTYKYSYPLSKYTKVLLDVTNNDFTWYAGLITSMKQNTAFANWLETSGTLGTLDQLEAYATGREAEARGQNSAAAAAYAKCIGFYDAEWRKDQMGSFSQSASGASGSSSGLLNARFCCEWSRGSIFYGRDFIGERCTIVASKGTARVRSGPGLDYPQCQCVYDGDMYYVKDIDVDPSSNKAWFKIDVRGMDCWISSGLTRINGLRSYILLDD